MTWDVLNETDAPPCHTSLRALILLLQLLFYGSLSNKYTVPAHKPKLSEQLPSQALHTNKPAGNLNEKLRTRDTGKRIPTDRMFGLIINTDTVYV